MYWLINPQKGGMGLAEIRDWGLLDFSLHSSSDQLFYKSGTLSATRHGFIPFTELGRGKRGPLHAAHIEITQVGKDSETPDLSHVPTRDVRN